MPNPPIDGSYIWRNSLPVLHFIVIYVARTRRGTPKLNRNLLARSLAVLLLGVLSGYYIDYDERKTRRLGREQYLAGEARKFDESISDPTPLTAMVVGAVLVIGFFVFVYEIVVMVISVALKSKTVGAGKPAEGTSIPFS
jgi:hypothetical protein